MSFNSHYNKLTSNCPEKIIFHDNLTCPMGHTNCYLHYENEQLCHFLNEEKMRNRELSEKIAKCSEEIDKLSKNFENKAYDYNELINRFRQSEQICKEQSRLIESLQKEIDVLRVTSLEEQNKNPFLENHQNGLRMVEKSKSKINYDSKVKNSINNKTNQIYKSSTNNNKSKVLKNHSKNKTK